MAVASSGAGGSGTVSKWAGPAGALLLDVLVALCCLRIDRARPRAAVVTNLRNSDWGFRSRNPAIPLGRARLSSCQVVAVLGVSTAGITCHGRSYLLGAEF